MGLIKDLFGTKESPEHKRAKQVMAMSEKLLYRLEENLNGFTPMEKVSVIRYLKVLLITSLTEENKIVLKEFENLSEAINILNKN